MTVNGRYEVVPIIEDYSEGFFIIGFMPNNRLGIKHAIENLGYKVDLDSRVHSQSYVYSVIYPSLIGDPKLKLILADILGFPNTRHTCIKYLRGSKEGRKIAKEVLQVLATELGTFWGVEEKEVEKVFNGIFIEIDNQKSTPSPSDQNV
jgi:hypothetical protein